VCDLFHQICPRFSLRSLIRRGSPPGWHRVLRRPHLYRLSLGELHGEISELGSSPWCSSSTMILFRLCGDPVSPRRRCCRGTGTSCRRSSISHQRAGSSRNLARSIGIRASRFFTRSVFEMNLGPAPISPGPGHAQLRPVFLRGTLTARYLPHMS